MASSRRVVTLSGHLNPIKRLQIRFCSQDAVLTSTDVLASRRDVPILDSHISYLDTGGNKPIVIFLHGNPTCAYLWRNIMPEVAPVARCLAPDLIGMGKSGDNPSGNYRFVDQYKYLSAWIEKMNFPGKLSLVIHDWGSALGFHWANLNRDRVSSIIHMESMVASIPDWNRFPELTQTLYKAIRKSPSGEEMVLKENIFIERLLPGSIMRKLSEEEMNVYRERFLVEGESRRPMLSWTRDVPVSSEGPADVMSFANDWYMWLKESKELPKLYVNGDPGYFSASLKRGISNWPNQEMVTVKGLHFLQEDSPVEIGQAIRQFLIKKVL